ncbi:MAG: hypothetical protein ACOCP8_07105 [archaeon]
MATRMCISCGAKFNDDNSTHPYTYCPHCGIKIEIPNKHKIPNSFSWTLTNKDREKIKNRNKDIDIK